MVASLPLSLCSIDCAVREKAENRAPSTQSELWDCGPSPLEVFVYIHLNIYFGNGSVRDSAGGGFVLHVQSPGFGP